MMLAANSWESLLTFVVLILLSAISNWIKRRSGKTDEEEEYVPPPPVNRVPPKPQQSYEEWKRAQQGLPQQPGGKSAPAQTVPAPMARRPVPVLVEEEGPNLEQHPELARIQFKKAEVAFEAGGRLDAIAAERMQLAKLIAERRVAAPIQVSRINRAVAGQNRGQLMQLLRQPGTLKQVIVATEIFGIPKSMREA